MNEEPILPSPDKEKKSLTALSFLFDVLEMFAWSVFLVFLIFTFGIRLCKVDGASMENTLYSGENLLVYSAGYTPAQDDIIVFHMTKPEVYLEKTLVKRVIATGGQSVVINFMEKEIYVDGTLYRDEHALLKSYYSGVPSGEYDLRANPPDHHYDSVSQTMSFTVPEGHLFVLGDNRNFSKDSRSEDVMFVDERTVLGKVVLRFTPFTVFS